MMKLLLTFLPSVKHNRLYQLNFSRMRQKYLPFMIILGVVFGGLFEYCCKNFISGKTKEVENVSIQVHNVASTPEKLVKKEEISEVVTSKTMLIKGPKDFRNKLYFLTSAQIEQLEKMFKKMSVHPSPGHRLFFSFTQKEKNIIINAFHYYTKHHYFDITINESITAVKKTIKREMKCLTGKINNSFYNAALHVGTPSVIVSECVLGLKQNHTSFRKGAPFKIVYDIIKMQNGYEAAPRLKYIEFDVRGKKFQLYYFEQQSGQCDFFDEKGFVTKQRGFQKPLKVKKTYISSGFGLRIHPITRRKHFHQGVDYQASRGTHIIPAASGRVVFAGTRGGYGRVVDVAHNNGYTTRYAHMSKILVKTGMYVNMTMSLGTVGDSGLATGPHLHFEIHKNGKPINPKGQIYFPQSKLYGVDYKNFCALKNSVRNAIAQKSKI